VTVPRNAIASKRDAGDLATGIDLIVAAYFAPVRVAGRRGGCDLVTPGAAAEVDGLAFPARSRAAVVSMMVRMAGLVAWSC
jgi:hypothetical protein